MRKLLIPIMLIVLTGCTGTHFATLPATGNEIDRDKVYRLMPGDIVEVDIPQQQDISGEYTLDPAGALFLPVIGRVSLNELTQDEARAALLRVLKTYYSPITLNLKIKSYQSSEFYVIMGEVAQPGVYPVQNRVSLLKAIGQASGFTAAADPRRVRISRNHDANQVLHINVQRILNRGDFTQDLILHADDVIYVPAKPGRRFLASFNEVLPVLQLAILTIVTLNQLNLN